MRGRGQGGVHRVLGRVLGLGDHTTAILAITRPIAAALAAVPDGATLLVDGTSRAGIEAAIVSLYRKAFA